MNFSIWFNTLFKEKTGNLYVQFFRYAFAGGTSFILDTGLMVLLKEVFQVHYLVAATAGFIVGLTYTYLLSIKWIFDERRLKNKWNELLVFTIIGVVGIGVTLLFMKFFTDILLIHYVLSKILTTIIVSLWNFAAKKLLLFTKKKDVLGNRHD